MARGETPPTGGCPAPGCGSFDIDSHPGHPGFHQCQKCGRLLAQLHRETIFGGQTYYVEPTRRSVQVHGPASELTDREIETEDG